MPESTASNLGLANVPIRVLSEPKPFAKNQYIQNIKKVVSCDMKFMKELKTFLKLSRAVLMRK